MSHSKILKIANYFSRKYINKFSQEESGGNLEYVKGAIFLSSGKIKEQQLHGERLLREHLGDEADKLIEARKVRDGEAAHITIISPPEVRAIISKIASEESISKGKAEDLFKSKIKNYEINNWNIEGLGKVSKDDKEAYFLVVTCDEAQRLRAQYGLDNKDFHITVGFRNSDIHGIPKDISTLV